VNVCDDCIESAFQNAGQTRFHQPLLSQFRRHFHVSHAHPLIQAYTVSRNQDDTASQGDHRATFSPERAPHKAAGLLATSSDDAHAPGHPQDPNHCERGY
jgi:hypothetical protein